MSAPAPSLAARALAAVLAARAAFGLTFLASFLGGLHPFLYEPERRTFTFRPRPGVIAMAWYGATGAAILAAVVAASLLWFASSRGPLSRWLAKSSAVVGLSRATALVLLVDFLYFGYRMSHQSPAAAPPAHAKVWKARSHEIGLFQCPDKPSRQRNESSLGARAVIS